MIDLRIQGPTNVQQEEKSERLPPEDTSGITVSFHHSVTEPAMFVTFKIPDSSIVLSRDKSEFMRWCSVELLKIIQQMGNF